jgi:two-component system chemotaxis response regulator CheB
VIRVLVVDDLAFMRIAIRRMIDRDAEMTVVGEARTGAEALALARSLQPDVITMDVEMPEMDGLEATSAIMAEVSPAPSIVMVSAMTQGGAATTLDALRRGAVDFVSKSSIFAATDLAHIENELLRIIRAWAARRDKPVPVLPRHAPPPAAPAAPDVIVIGSSTGGPQALSVLLGAMGRVSAPVVIAQHMPRYFTASLAEMLAADTKQDVREGAPHEVVQGGTVYMVPGGQHGALVRGLAGFRLVLTEATDGISPSVDRLFHSAATTAAMPLGVVLTGMGSDGRAGALALRARAAGVLVQAPAECVVAGMPESAITAGAASAVLRLADIAAWIGAACGTAAGGTGLSETPRGQERV